MSTDDQMQKLNERISESQSRDLVQLDQADAERFGGVMSVAVAKQFDNFDGDNMHRFKLASIASKPQHKRFNQQPTDGIALKWFHVSAPEFERGANGELEQSMRIVLIDANYDSWIFWSGGVARGLSALVSIVGKGPYDPPIKLKVMCGPAKSGQQYWIETIE